MTTLTAKDPLLVQFCLKQIEGDQYCLLKSYYPAVNEPGDHCEEIARGTVDEMIEYRKTHYPKRSDVKIMR